LRAVADAASQDPSVEEVYRFGLLERLVGAVAARISRDVEAGVSPDEPDPEETARALVLMTKRYLLDAFGRPEGRPPRDKTADVVGVLEKVWSGLSTDPRRERRSDQASPGPNLTIRRPPSAASSTARRSG
jgi:TetR/AcrR family transcriptional regulator, ethionamide resistance regulator